MVRVAVLKKDNISCWQHRGLSHSSLCGSVCAAMFRTNLPSLEFELETHFCLKPVGVKQQNQDLLR